MTTLGNELKRHLGPRLQKEAALGWIEGWKTLTGEDVPFDTVESSLSRCMKNKPEGVKYFFQDLRRTKLLLDELGVPAEARADLGKLADGILKAAGPRALRLVVDATKWSDKINEVHAWAAKLREEILAAGLVPATILVTERQIPLLPRTFDADMPTDLVPRPVVGSESVEALVRELARESALVIAPWVCEPYERWAATGSGGTFKVSPSDALERFARDGRLEPRTKAARDLRDLGVEPALEAAPPLPSDACALRDLVDALADAGRAAELTVRPQSLFYDARRNEPVTPEIRLAWALKLHAPAAATAAEIVEWEIATIADALGMAPDDDTEGALDRALARLSAGDHATKLFRGGDHLHVVGVIENVPEHVREHARVTPHLVAKRDSALARLRRETDTWTRDDFLDDPYLERAIAATRDAADEPVVVLHAQASILRSRSLGGAQSRTVPDWRGALSALLAGAPPEARVLLEDGAEHVFVRGDWPTAERIEVLGAWAMAPCARELLVSRDDSAGVWTAPRDAVETWMAPTDAVETWMDGFDGDTEGSIVAWLDALEAHVDTSPIRDQRGNERPRVRPTFEPPAELQDDPFAPSNPRSWPALDGLLASMWLALRGATRSSDAVTAADGSVVVHVGAGVMAQVAARSHERNDGSTEVRAAFRATHSRSCGGVPAVDLMTHVTAAGGEASTHFAGHHLPRGLYLSGHGFAVDVTFSFAPWFSTSPLTPLSAAVASTIEASERASWESAPAAQAESNDDD